MIRSTLKHIVRSASLLKYFFDEVMAVAKTAPVVHPPSPRHCTPPAISSASLYIDGQAIEQGNRTVQQSRVSKSAEPTGTRKTPGCALIPLLRLRRALFAQLPDHGSVCFCWSIIPLLQGCLWILTGHLTNLQQSCPNKLAAPFV